MKKKNSFSNVSEELEYKISEAYRFQEGKHACQLCVHLLHNDSELWSADVSWPFPNLTFLSGIHYLVFFLNQWPNYS